MRPIAESRLNGSPAGARRPDNLYLFARHAFFYTTPVEQSAQLQPHSATVLVNAYDRPFDVVIDGQTHTTRGIAMGSLLRRQVFAPSTGMIALFIMPESRLFPRFLSLGPQRFMLLDRDALAPVNSALVALYEGHAEREDVLLAYRSLRAMLGEPEFPEGLDAAYHRARELMQLIAENPDLSLEELAAVHQMTYSWMSRLFSHSVGIPLRDYKNWLRRRTVWELLATDLSLTEIAHRAGFSDSAHLSRTYRRWFGMSPSESRKRKQVQFFRFMSDAAG